MGKIFYIADMHFGHKNSIAFDNRPFFTVAEMDDAMIANWNNKVSTVDDVYVLGDMFWCNKTEALDILEKLNYNKIFLVKGNHDRCNSGDFVRKFAKISEYMEIEDEGRKIVLCHYPIPCFKNHYHGWYHLYGHVHNSFEHNMILNFKSQMINLYEKECKMYNVGCMMPYIDYTPRTLGEIIEGNGE